MNKSAIKNFAMWAREKLIADIIYKAGLYGVTENGAPDPLPASTADLKLFDIGTSQPAKVSGEAIGQRQKLIAAIRLKRGDFKTAFHQVMEEVAYTWFNRLIALRFMEVNDYLPSRVRVLSSENPNKAEPDFVTTPFETDLEFTDDQRREVLRMKEENRLNDLFRMLFIMQCNKLHEILPRLFEPTDDYTELLLNLSFTDKDGVVWRLTHDIPEQDFNVGQDGQIEIIGWLYQHYNTELKNQVFANLKKNIKISKEDIPAATQLFTPEWIVRYMVENSLGRIWVEGHPDFDRSGWRYYLEEAEQTPEVQAQLDALRESRKSLRPEEIKCIDPCAGSGHVLDYMFDVLLQIYESQGYNRRDAASLILKNNLYGLDIDERAAQLAYFSVMMKARGVDRKFFTRGVQPHVYDVPETYGELAKPSRKFDMGIQLYNAFRDGKEVGSLLDVGLSESELNQLKLQMDEMERTGDATDLAAAYAVRPLWEIAMMLTQKYHIVATNPPYMGSSNMNNYLSKFVKDNYSDSKSDLFAVFIECCRAMTLENGYQAMITQHAWMFLSSFEKLRLKLGQMDTVNMAHLGARAFEEIGGEVVQTTAFVLQKRHITGYIGTYCRLIEPTSQQGKENMFLSGNNRFIAQQDNFAKIPGAPIAYWLSDAFFINFSSSSVGDVFFPKFGMSTGDGERFIRNWFEVSYSDICHNLTCEEDAKRIALKWVPVDKGGTYRKWYGNRLNVVWWENNGCEIKKHPKSAVRNPQYFFRRHVSWTLVSTGHFSSRYFENGFALDTASNCLYSVNDEFEYVLGLLNSVVADEYLSVLNPTMNFSCGIISLVPFIEKQKTEIMGIVSRNVEISCADWNSFETSWDFQTHPLIRWRDKLRGVMQDGMNVLGPLSEGVVPPVLLALCYEGWKAECDDRFNRLKANEEELNRIFIDIYGLRDELTPEVQDRDVTVRRVDLGRDIRSLISYAVGCMFGRYALNVPGLVFAGGSFDDVYGSEEATLADHNGDTIVTHDGDAIALRIPYGVVKRDGREIPLSFRPDADNCILITDEPYFEDDIVGRFVDFIRVVYGAETLEENLAFIAKALDGKGNTSREVIRQYFLNDFYKDHLKIYQKRPIYWLFDSGKQNGFKALVYMHRWNADTAGNVRVEYLHRLQRVYEKEIARMKQVMESGSAREATAAAKRLDRLTKQLKETREYDTRIAHAALSRVTIDLDDGVKVNYEKVQQGPDGKSLNLLAKIK